MHYGSVLTNYSEFSDLQYLGHSEAREDTRLVTDTRISMRILTKHDRIIQ